MENFNELDEESAKLALSNCCGATKWVNLMMEKRPFTNVDEMLTASRTCWDECNEEDWKEAFTHHPKIGDLASLKEKYAATRKWAAKEQSGVAVASPKVLQELAKGNRAYEVKFGYIFIVCATGKSAKEMLTILKGRIHNHRRDEIQIAKEEQFKITQIRIHKLLGNGQLV